MKAYEKLKFYQNICKLRAKIYKITEKFVKGHYKVVGQTRDAIRSAKQNIREGYNKDSLGEFMRSIKISRGSLEETEGDIDDYHEDKLILDGEYEELKTLFRKSDYQMVRYMDSLIKLEKQGKWKQRWTLSNHKATKSNRNVTSSNCTPSNHNRGSALIITLLLITIVAAMVFSVGKLATSELKLSTQLEESDLAYYAAESGIEAGLLMLRFSHNVEIPTGATLSTTSGLMEKTMGDGQSFHLKIYHRNDTGFECVPKEACDANGEWDSDFSYDPLTDTPALAKDQVWEYDIRNPDGSIQNNLNIEWEYETTGATNTENQRMEIIPIDAGGEPIAAGKYLSLSTQTSLPIDTTNASKLRIKPWGGNLVKYKLTSGDSDAKLDSRYTTIESTGYFGKTKRKMQVTIDRASGTLLGLHDFVIFGSSGFAGPTPSP